MSSGSSPSPPAKPGQDCCQHAGYYSAIGVYSRDSRTLRYVLVCDDCGQEMKEVSAQEYAPNPVFVAA